MTTTIKKIRLVNFKRFSNYIIEPNERINILVGDNEVGKSTILEAIDLVTYGSLHHIESIGFDKLLNIEAVRAFNAGNRTFDNLPKLQIELYLNLDRPEPSMNGRNNIDKVKCDGIRLICAPNPDYRSEVTEALNANPEYFPYDYYSFRHSTFADEGYTNYKKKIRVAMIDSTNMNSEYATSNFVRRMYMQYTEFDKKERARHQCEYRLIRNSFCSTSLTSLNERVPSDKKYTFGLKSGNFMSLENDLMIYENDIGIDNKGTGKQIFVKTDFALERAGDNVDIILIEEPENHLSPVNLRKLIQLIDQTRGGQIFITTHSSLISTRLELQNLFIMHTNCHNSPIILKNLRDDTAKYFMKAPPANILEYVLARKVIIVEGPSEYMLLERFYRDVTGHTPETDNVHIIDIRGLSFLRYLEIAKLIGIQVAVITDNDGDHKKNCVAKYEEYAECDNIKIFYDSDDAKQTFEVILYKDNEELCNRLYEGNVQYFMLKNKTESAYILLSQTERINVPYYIKNAIEWIR